MKIIVGLGNPGEKYQDTRHNLGFRVLDDLGKQLMVDGVWLMDKKFNVKILKVDFSLVLIKPQTHMNASGIAVKQIADYFRRKEALPHFKVESEDIIVIHDELDLPLGKIKIRLGGSAAGHHGVESIIENLGSDKFVRVRLGIGDMKIEEEEKNPKNYNTTDFVLSEFKGKEKVAAAKMVKKAVEAITTLLDKGLIETQNKYH